MQVIDLMLLRLLNLNLMKDGVLMSSRSGMVL